MLATLRSGATSVLVKMLLLLIVVSFVIWGIGDIFKGTTMQDVATIGGKQSISRETLDRAVRQEVGKLQQVLGGNVTSEKIKELGIEQIVLERLVNRGLMEVAAASLNIQVGNDAVVRDIRMNPDFQGKDKKFEKSLFDRILNANNLSEETYAAALRKDIATHIVAQSLLAEKMVPAILAETIYLYKKEKRKVDIAIVPKDRQATVAEPTESDIKAYYDAHKTAFTAPEYRSFSYLTLKAEDMVSKVAISENELKMEYEARIADFQRPEKRDVINLVFASEDEAKVAAKHSKNKHALLAYAKETQGKEEKDLTLKAITKTDLPKEVQEQVFSLKKNTVSSPTQSALGWHLFVVTAVTPAGTDSYEDVKEMLQNELRQKKADNALYSTATKLEDEFAGGASLEEVSSKFGFQLKKIEEVTQTGETRNGEKLALPSIDNFLSIGFSTEDKGISPVSLSSDNKTYFVLRVDSMQPSHVKPLTEVKEKVVSGWKREKQEEANRKLLEELITQVKAGKSMTEAALGLHIDIKTDEILERPSAVIYGTAEKRPYPNSFIEAVFALKKGDISPVYQSEKGDFIAARVGDIITASKEDKAGIMEVKQELEERSAGNILDQYIMYLRKLYPVKVPAVASAKPQGE